MSPFEALLEFIRQHLLQSLVILAIGVSFLRKFLQQASEDQARRKAGGMPPQASPDDDLREQVRRGFEEMMRQRAAAAAARTAAKAPAKATAKAAPKAAPKTPPRMAPSAMSGTARAAPSRAPAAPAPSLGAPPPFDPLLARAAVMRMAALSKEKQGVRRALLASPSTARRLLSDRPTVRRAFLLSEILGPPRSLRTGS